MPSGNKSLPQSMMIKMSSHGLTRPQCVDTGDTTPLLMQRNYVSFPQQSTTKQSTTHKVRILQDILHMNPLPENGHSDHFSHIEDSLNVLDIMFRQVIIVHTTANVSCQTETGKMNSIKSNLYFIWMTHWSSGDVIASLISEHIGPLEIWVDLRKNGFAYRYLQFFIW